MKFEIVHNEALAATIYVQVPSASAQSQSPGKELTGTAIRSLMTMPAQTAIAAWR